MDDLIVCIRDGEIKVSLPLKLVDIRDDGTIWYINGNPLLCPLPEDRAAIIALAKDKKWADIPDSCFARFGKINGAQIMYQSEWLKHPEYLKRKKERMKTVGIILSFGEDGWSSNVEWNGDITRPTNDILAECKTLLANANYADKQNITDKELLCKIANAKSGYAEQIEEDKQRKRKLAEKNMRRQAAEMETDLEIIEDEGGKTIVAYHTICLQSGDKIKFQDRNVFDFGRVINPEYEITPGIRGGLRRGDNWQTFDKEKGWINVRQLTEAEKEAYAYVLEFGYHAKNTIRI